MDGDAGNPLLRQDERKRCYKAMSRGGRLGKVLAMIVFLHLAVLVLSAAIIVAMAFANVVPDL